MSVVRDPSTKVLTREEAVQWRRAQLGVVVFTNGVFDLLHPGHVDVLRAARAEGDVLIVALNTDDSVRRLKGPERPIRGEAERAYVLAAFEMVDAVTLFGEDTPAELIERVRPDVVVKGGDYTAETVVGAKETIARGGRVVIVPLTAGQSTTSIVARLRADSPSSSPSRVK